MKTNQDEIPLQSLFSASGVMLHMDAVREGNGGQFPLVERKNRIFKYAVIIAKSRQSINTKSLEESMKRQTLPKIGTQI